MEHATAFRGLFLVIGIASSLLLMSVGWASMGGASQATVRKDGFGESNSDSAYVEVDVYVRLQEYDPGWDPRDEAVCYARVDEDGGGGATVVT
jgi:hypothetical protein